MREYRKRDLAERFWEKVDKTSPDGCWPWTAAASALHGYGRFSHDTARGPRRRSFVRNAHTVAWELDRGRKLPPGKVVRHQCDNPICCNPKHLLLGTHAQNVRDKIRRGRFRPELTRRVVGEEHGRARLTEIDVIAMRAARARGMSVRALADVYGVHEMTASHAIRRITWKHVE